MHSTILGFIIGITFEMLNRPVSWQGISGTITFSLFDVVMFSMITFILLTGLFLFLRSYFRD